MKRYVEIANIIRERIINKIYPVGGKIPYERELCEEFSCSKPTMKKALEILVQEGYIIRQRGSGTIVKTNQTQAPTTLQKGLHLYGLSTLYGSERMRNEVLAFDIINPPKEIADKLTMSESEFVYNFKRVRYLDNNPISIEETYIPIRILPSFTVELATHSVYQYIEDTLKKMPTSAHTLYYARPSSADDQKYLLLDAKEPVSVTEAVAYLNDGQAFEFSITHYHYKHFNFKTVVTRE